MTRTRIITLTADEHTLMFHLAMHDHWLADHITFSDQGGAAPTIQLHADVIEPIREYLTVVLAKTGFNADYTLSSAGRMLESIIDKLFSEKLQQND